MLPPAGFRIVLAQYDAVGGLQVVDGSNVVAVQAHNFHVLLNVQSLDHVAAGTRLDSRRKADAGLLELCRSASVVDLVWR